MTLTFLEVVLRSYQSYGTRWPSGTRLDFAIARSRVRLLPVAAVYQRLLSLPSLRGRLMSSSLRATGWRPSAADWGGGISVVLRRGSTCPLSRQWMGLHTAPRYHQLMPISCHFQDCEALLFVLTTCKQRYIKYPGFFHRESIFSSRTNKKWRHHQSPVFFAVIGFHFVLTHCSAYPSRPSERTATKTSNEPCSRQYVQYAISWDTASVREEKRICTLP